MAQRLGIATALLGDPEVLLLDEPVNGLDPEGIRWLRTLLHAQAAQGRTVLVSSHLISEMALTAERLVVIGQGRLLAETTVDALSATASSLEEAFLALTSGVTSFQETAGHGGAGQNMAGQSNAGQSNAGQGTVAGQTGRVS
jgi:ABC-2 type transport system ATP-binding protein